MEEFFKALRHFLTRDIVFMIGGGSVVGIFLRHFHQVPSADSHIVLFLLLGGISYAVGYALQDGFSITHLTTTTKPRRLCWIARAAYERFTREKWKDIPDSVEFDTARRYIYEDNEHEQARYQRLITLRQVGGTLGPCALVSSALFFWTWLDTRASFDLAGAVAALVLSIIFSILSWIKAAEHAKMLERWYTNSGGAQHTAERRRSVEETRCDE